MWEDSYADKYQRINGFKMKLKVSEEEELEGFISLEPSTRSTYDIAMRDATIDGLVTMDKIEELKPGRIFNKTDLPSELFILQSVNKFEFQKKTMRVNAIKQNCFVTVQRMNYESSNYEDIYTDLISFVTMFYVSFVNIYNLFLILVRILYFTSAYNIKCNTVLLPIFF